MISTRKQLELKLLFQSHRRHSWGLEGRAQWRSYSIYCAGCAKHKGPRLSEGPLRSWDPRRSWTPRALSGYRAPAVRDPGSQWALGGEGTLAASRIFLLSATELPNA